MTARTGPPITFADFVGLALEMSTSSPCRKSKLGAVAFNGRENERRELVAVGWNHRPGGEACDGSPACRATCRLEAVHAEQVLIVSTANLDGADVIHAKSVDGALVASGGPSCEQCAKLLRAAGVAGVWLYHEPGGWRRYPIAEFHALSMAAAAALSSLEARIREELAEVEGCTHDLCSMYDEVAEKKIADVLRRILSGG